MKKILLLIIIIVCSACSELPYQHADSDNKMRIRAKALITINDKEYMRYELNCNTDTWNDSFYFLTQDMDIGEVGDYVKISKIHTEVKFQ